MGLFARQLVHILLALALVLLSAPVLASARIAAWNIENLGWGAKKDMQAVATVLAQFDLIAVIELMRPEALLDLEERLEKTTGQEWESMASEPVGSASRREHYGFIWRKDRVRYVDGAVVFIDTDDSFAREPFSARFEDRTTQSVFALAVVHILYGQSVKDRVPELHALAEYWDWLREVYPDTPRILAGDFNMPPSHPALEELRSKAKPLIVAGATTLSSKDGRYANLYDNLWVEPEGFAIKAAGIKHFPQLLGLTHKQARAQVSDHAPVYLELSADSASLGLPQSACISLNTASKRELQGLPHIGPARAEAIVKGRPWAGVSDLTRLSGIGTARVADIRASNLLCE